MQRIVVNRCYGGFSLSLLAEREYLKRKGKKAFFYEQTKYKHSDGVEEYTRLDNIDKESTGFIHTFTKDLGEKCTESKINKEWDKHSWYCRTVERDDPDLVAVVEELGDKANGECSQLEIVEIPDDVKWEISEYDGNESVDEVHRSW